MHQFRISGFWEKYARQLRSIQMYKSKVNYFFLVQYRREIPVLESIFKQFAETVMLDLNFIKKRPAQLFSCEYCKIFKIAYFEKYLQTVPF